MDSFCPTDAVPHGLGVQGVLCDRAWPPHRRLCARRQRHRAPVWAGRVDVAHAAAGPAPRRVVTHGRVGLGEGDAARHSVTHVWTIAVSGFLRIRMWQGHDAVRDDGDRADGGVCRQGWTSGGVCWTVDGVGADVRACAGSSRGVVQQYDEPKRCLE